jgi:Kef-type K+ transport system membrane component KefB
MRWARSCVASGGPPVVGALAAGRLLSPSVLGAISPDAYQWLFPDDPRQQGLLQGVAWIGVALLVLITGFETNLRDASAAPPPGSRSSPRSFPYRPVSV